MKNMTNNEELETVCKVWKSGTTHVVSIPRNIREVKNIKFGDLVKVKFGNVVKSEEENIENLEKEEKEIEEKISRLPKI